MGAITIANAHLEGDATVDGGGCDRPGGGSRIACDFPAE
jgi:hypothetical protein